MTAALPKNVELFFRRVLCCFCCGLEANVDLQNYSHISTHTPYFYFSPPLNSVKYETTAFLTYEDILKLSVPLCFSFASLCGVLFHIFCFFFHEDAIHTKIALVAFVSFITSTFVCRYIYTFETSIKKQLKLVLLSNLICLEKYFALFIAISSFITLIFDLFTYMSVSEDVILKHKLSDQERNLFFVQFLWEGSVFLWSSLWYKLALRAEKFALENFVETTLPPLNLQSQRNRGFFPQEAKHPHYPYYPAKGCEAFIASRNNCNSTNAKFPQFPRIEGENAILVDSADNNKRRLNNIRHLHYCYDIRQNNIFALGSVYTEKNLKDNSLNDVNSSMNSNMSADGVNTISNKEEGNTRVAQKKETSGNNHNVNTKIFPQCFDPTHPSERCHEKKGVKEFDQGMNSSYGFHAGGVALEAGDSAWLLRDRNTLPVAIGRPVYSCYKQNHFLDNAPNSYYNDAIYNNNIERSNIINYNSNINNRNSNNNHGDSNNNDGDSNNNHGNSSNNHGDSNNNHGDSNNNDGDSNNNHGNSSKNHGDSNNNHRNSSKNHCDSNNNHRNSSKNHGDSNNNHRNSSKNHGDSNSNHRNSSNNHSSSDSSSSNSGSHFSNLHTNK